MEKEVVLEEKVNMAQLQRNIKIKSVLQLIEVYHGRNREFLNDFTDMNL